jgi:hypothetical protein
MSCCAAKADGEQQRVAALFRGGFHQGLLLAERSLSLGAPYSRRALLWRDFAAMLRESEEQDLACALGQEQGVGVVRLRRALAGRLLRRAPGLAGIVHRRLRTARPPVILDLAAQLAAGALESHGR